MDRLPYAVHIVTSILLVNMTVALFGAPQWLFATLFLAGPFLVGWMVYRVLRDKSVPMEDLRAGAEWGYADRTDLRPVDQD
ncbi:MAG: hypothetical protein KDB77_12050 [Flavobacteriales bacterium]|nr:hypothetical protein [Flavobacteriales bacterium]MCB0818235.1 hypothetical protein [Flavobacteriales bacterium]HRW90420.1 hypothetical protein [Flavobacteriales bacterium]